MNSNLVAQARLQTPLGPVTVAATARGLAGLWFDHQRHHPGDLDARHDAHHPHLLRAAEDLKAYWRDARHRFTVPLDPQGTAFQRQVWELLRRIGSGQVKSYGAIAAALGRPQAARAVGAAIGRNPISIIVPCHRALGQGGALTGYAGGLPRKEALLQREGSLPAPPANTHPAPATRRAHGTPATPATRAGGTAGSARGAP